MHPVEGAPLKPAFMATYEEAIRLVLSGGRKTRAELLAYFPDAEHERAGVALDEMIRDRSVLPIAACTFSGSVYKVFTLAPAAR